MKEDRRKAKLTQWMIEAARGTKGTRIIISEGFTPADSHCPTTVSVFLPPWLPVFHISTERYKKKQERKRTTTSKHAS